MLVKDNYTVQMGIDIIVYIFERLYPCQRACPHLKYQMKNQMILHHQWLTSTFQYFYFDMYMWHGSSITPFFEKLIGAVISLLYIVRLENLVRKYYSNSETWKSAYDWLILNLLNRALNHSFSFALKINCLFIYYSMWCLVLSEIVSVSTFFIFIVI